MQQAKLGQVSPSPKGDWSAKTTYANADIVRHQNTAYIALQQSTGIEPSEHSFSGTYWMPLAVDGDKSDLDAIAQAIDLASSVINMSVSAQSIDYGMPPSVLSAVDSDTGNISLIFQIPRNANLPDIPQEHTFRLDAGSWEVVEVHATSHINFTTVSHGVQDFSSLTYKFDEGMTWKDFALSEYNTVKGGQFGAEYPGAASNATSGRKIVCRNDIGIDMSTSAVVMSNSEEVFVDYWDLPYKTLYLNGIKVEPTDLIVNEGNYTAR